MTTVFALFSCNTVCKDDQLTLQKQPYYGNELRIDGYYYLIYGNPQKASIYFFYRDGTVIDGGVYDYDKIAEYESIINTTLINKIKKTKYSYGLFNIQNDWIKFECWSPSEPPLKAYAREGEILSDSTFHITKLYRSDGTEMSVRDEIYHFKQFSPKPDSTNVYIK